MAETLISPGVLARENDQSQITSQPIQAGAAIVGPTVKGQVNIPKLITTYSEYQANFGTTFESGSANQKSEYTFLTSISAYNYFSNGGTSLIVTRVASGSFTAASSSKIANDQETGTILAATNLLGSAVGGGDGDAPFSGVPAFSGGSGTGLTLNAAVTTNGGVKIAADALLSSITVNPSDAVDGTYATTILSGGTGTNLTASVVVSGQTITGITVPVATSGSGYIATDSLTIAAGALSAGELVVGTSAVPTGAGVAAGAYANSQTSNAITITAGMVDTVGASGGTLTITTDGTGATIAGAAILVASSTGYVNGSIITIPEATLQADPQLGAAGTGGDMVFVVGASNVELSSAGTIVLDAADLFYSLTTLNAATEGIDYEVNDILVIAAGAMGTNSSECTITLVDADIVDGNAFILESMGQGTIMNSTGAENSQGALTNGTSDNLRWEISSPNTSSGTFSVVIRQGNDNTRAKSVLESFNNVSLDPKSSNYISRIIGDQTQVVRGSGTDVYLQTTGSYANASRYVRVKEVNFKTPDYLDNSGTAKTEYTASIPVQASGTFGDAVGSILTGTGKYYDKIDGNDTQGLVGGNYTTAFNLLANKDDFKYNVISTPGLVYSEGDYKSVLNTLIANTENRGDNIIILDLELYASSITAATTTANDKDTSYAAAYWPWCMVTDPDSGQRVWVPGGTLIPGVYANNDRTAEAWFAPAGINRGGLSQVIQAERKLTQANRDDLYINKVNPIATFPGRGVVVFGQKTLQNQASALDRVNVRRLLIALKNYISQISDNLVFEQNTAATRNTFLSQVNPYLESVQQRQGLYAFKVVMNESNNGPDVIDRNELRGAIYIQPTKTAEFIYLDFNILPTGAEFPS